MHRFHRQTYNMHQILIWNMLTLIKQFLEKATKIFFFRDRHGARRGITVGSGLSGEPDGPKLREKNT